VVLKAENLQRTGSFKLRGATPKPAGLRATGVVAEPPSRSVVRHA
jgi:threonine dehydratase